MGLYLKVPSHKNGTAFRRALEFIGEHYGNINRFRGRDKAFKAGCRFIAKKIGHSITSVQYMAKQKGKKLYFHKQAYIKAYECILRYLMRDNFFSCLVNQEAYKLLVELKREHSNSVSDGIAYCEKNNLKVWARGEQVNWQFPVVKAILDEYDIEDAIYYKKWRKI